MYYSFFLPSLPPSRYFSQPSCLQAHQVGKAASSCGQESCPRRCSCCNPEAPTAPEEGRCCLEESKKIRAKGNTMGGQRLTRTSRGMEAAGSGRVQPTWWGAARLCVAPCKKVLLQKGFRRGQVIPTRTRELSRKCLCCVTHNISDADFWEFRARSEFQELPKIIIQTTPGLGMEGPAYNPAPIHPASGWSEPLHPIKHGDCCFSQTIH